MGAPESVPEYRGDVHRSLRVVPRRGNVDLPAAERAVADLLVALGKNPAVEQLADTPRRVARSFAFRNA